MPKVLTIEAPNLGALVELREQTVGEWLISQEQAATDSSPAQGTMRMLADVLYIDGQRVGWDRLQSMGIFEVQPALSQLNTLLGGREDDPAGNR